MENSIYLVEKEDERYPEKLKHIASPPKKLYVRGGLPRKDALTIAVVGARNCTPYGREMAKYFARELAYAGVQIVSGMARGVDSYAHWGALEAEGETFAVLGCGVDICYPRENNKLYEKLMLRGGVLSEYEPGVPPLPGHFPQRNRIISGLCDGILVIEAREKSGSLITVGQGLEEGRDIFALPGRCSDPLSRGCNRIIRQGAVLVEAPEQILEEYSFFKGDTLRKNKKKHISLETKEKIVYSRLSLEPKHLNTLVEETGWSVSEVMKVLLDLELSGRIRDAGGGYYVIML